MTTLSVGDSAPQLSMTTSEGHPISLGDFRGKSPVVVFFYPKDNSPICTREVCRFRDDYSGFQQAGAAVIGISGDSDESHQSFSSSNGLQFPLVSDHDGSLRKAFGVPRTMGILPGRVTYVIDRDGIVQLVFNSQLSGEHHVEQALAMVRKLG